MQPPAGQSVPVSGNAVLMQLHSCKDAERFRQDHLILQLRSDDSVVRVGGSRPLVAQADLLDDRLGIVAHQSLTVRTNKSHFVSSRFGRHAEFHFHGSKQDRGLLPSAVVQ